MINKIVILSIFAPPKAVAIFYRSYLSFIFVILKKSIACNLIANIGDGFRNNERTDFRDIDSFEVMEKAKKKYESYCLIATDDTELCNCPLWNGEEKYKAIPITLYINNKGTTKNPKGGCFMRYNFSMTNKNPKNDRNHRNKNIMKAIVKIAIGFFGGLKSINLPIITE